MSQANRDLLAVRLGDKLRSEMAPKDFITVGVLENCLIVYVNKRAKSDALKCIPEDYEGEPVVIKKTTPQRPAKARPKLEW